jgi:YfiH family protein
MVTRNRAFLRNTLSLPAEPCWLRQVHGTHVVAIDRPHPNPPPQAGEGAVSPAALADALPRLTGEGVRRAEGGNIAVTSDGELRADAAVTGMPGVVLAIQTADCLPVLFCVDDGSEIAAAHAGWRGLSAGVLENTLGAMPSPRERIMAWIGPAIAARSYEVGSEVRGAFLAHDSAAATAFMPTRAGHWLCDLSELARRRLRSAGVERIFGGGFDTFSDPRLHSYRRDRARSGRMANLVWMLTPEI